MREYQKIETLFTFDNNIKRFRPFFYNPIVEYLKDCIWFGSEKVDGTNTRILWDGHSFTFAGRTDNSQLPKEMLLLLETTFNKDMEIAVEQNFGEKEVIFFMECYAGKIQGHIYSGGEKLIGFDIMVNGIYLDRNDSKTIFTQLNLAFVPTMPFNNIYDAIDYVENHEISIIDKTAKLEGLVCYPAVRLYNHQGERVIVKIKRRDLEKLESKLVRDDLILKLNGEE